MTAFPLAIAFPVNCTIGGAFFIVLLLVFSLSASRRRRFFKDCAIKQAVSRILCRVFISFEPVFPQFFKDYAIRVRLVHYSFAPVCFRLVAVFFLIAQRTYLGCCLSAHRSRRFYQSFKATGALSRRLPAALFYESLTLRRTCYNIEKQSFLRRTA